MKASHACLLFAATCAALLCCAACAGHSSQVPEDSAFQEDLKIQGPGLGAGLPNPGELAAHSSAYTLLDLKRNGAQYETGLPSNGVSVNGTAIDMNASGVDMATAAYAIYSFPLAGYDRDANLVYSWATAPADFTDVYLGLSNWQENRWEWHNTNAGGLLPLGDLTPYIGPDPPGYMYVVVILAGAISASLDNLQVGTNLPADTLYVVPSQTTADPGEAVRLTVMCSGSLHPFHSLEALRVVVPQYNSYVPGSLNAGAVGGSPTAIDGVWTTVGSTSITLPPDVDLLPVDLGGGLIAYDFYVHASGGGDLAGASGELFNFELAVYTDVSIALMRSDGSTDRTFYTDQSGSPHVWTYDDNANGQGIALSGNALPQASITADTLFSVTLPFDVNFDASGSSDTLPGSIVGYEFDFGDGGGYIDNGSNPIALHTYASKGKFPATVRVTDNEGGQATASVDIYAAYYDEVEPNNTRATGNTLPPLPVSGFQGSLGSSSQIVVYDGGTSDYFNCTASTGDTIQIKVTFDARGLDLGVNLFDKNGAFLAQSQMDGKSPQVIDWTVGANQSPLNILLIALSGASDYTMDISINPPVADLQANPMQGDPPLQVDISGAGSYDPPPGSIVKYEFDFGEGNGWEDYNLTTVTQHTYEAEGSFLVKLRVTDDIGLTDTEQLTIKVGNPYNEVEDNDDHAQANAVTFPMGNWAGSLGTNPPTYPGYDGDDRDFVKFSAAAGQTINFSLQGDSNTADIDIHLEDIDGNMLAESITPEANESFQYTFTADGEYWIYIELWYDTTQDGYSDYFCNGSLM